MVYTKTYFIISVIIESFNASYFVLRVPGVPQLNSFIYGNKTEWLLQKLTGAPGSAHHLNL